MLGGYFELEKADFCNSFDNVIALNSARNCLKYVVRAFNIREIYIPFYTCPVIWQTLKKENCTINFYHIDKNFYPKEDFPENAFILYTNYLGINASNVKKLASLYKNLIIDNSQAFYMPFYGIASFNSLRKFFGVPDGAFLYTDKFLDIDFKTDSSLKRLLHLLKRKKYGYKSGLNDFYKNENSLNTDIMYMSKITKKLIKSIDINFVKERRMSNFKMLDYFLLSSNGLKIILDEEDVPMYYPYLNFNIEVEKLLIKNGIYVERLWNPMPLNTVEGVFQKHLMLLPIDQRYSKVNMQRIINIIFSIQ